LQEKLQTGKVLVMFDGLDEVFEPTQREQVITDIHRFTNDYPQVRVIVTSRIIGYKHQRLRDAEFRHFLLQDLNSRQIKDFIYRWHELTFTDEADKLRKQERLQRSIDSSKAIAELAGNPLLLTMMAILNRNQELPRDRPELYNQASRVLLHQWDVERKLLEDPRVDPVTIDYKDKQGMLRQIAHFMQAADKGLAGNLIQADDLEKILSDYLKTIEVSNARKVARLLIEQLRGRNFILCFLGADSYGFVHRTFLEYFCAWEFVWQFQQTQTLSIEELKTEVFGKHWQDESWHEVLRLIAGMIDPRFTAQVIEYLISQDGEADRFMNVFLAADCLAEVRNLSGIATTADKLFEELEGLTNYDLNYYYPPFDKEADLVREIRSQAVAAVVKIWQDHPETLPLLKQWADYGKNSYLQKAAVSEIAHGWKYDSNTLPWLKQQAQSNDSFTVRGIAVSEIARSWKDDSDTLPWLKQQAQSNDSFTVRGIAVSEIAHGWKYDSDTLPLLKQQAKSDKNLLVRRLAVQKIARGWKDDSDTLLWLKQRAQSDDNCSVRQRVITEIARGWKDEPDTLPWLKQQAQSDESWFVRGTAVSEIARCWKNDPNTLPWLKQRAQFDDNWFVRQTAMQQIAGGWKDEPDTLPWLKQQAQFNNSLLVQATVAREIARGWKDEPDTLPLLQQWAQSDYYRVIRHTTVEEFTRALAFLWQDYPDILLTPKQLVLSDDNENWQYAAVVKLAHSWKDDPETLPLLKHLVQSDEHENVRCTAIEEIARGWKNEPWMLEFLRNCALNDPFERQAIFEENPRKIALEIIIEQYPNHPDTLSLLQDRAENDLDEQLREFAQQKLVELP
ncbi:MAG: NTPase, partial [Symploca sp. SIO1B1]|nr:NTPase [Symploca sp. SIO1B1]